MARTFSVRRTSCATLTPVIDWLLSLAGFHIGDVLWAVKPVKKQRIKCLEFFFTPNLCGSVTNLHCLKLIKKSSVKSENKIRILSGLWRVCLSLGTELWTSVVPQDREVNEKNRKTSFVSYLWAICELFVRHGRVS